MYRKQVRRRRAVLALLIVGSFVLLTVTYGQGSNGVQRGVSAVFSPIQSVADRALKPARDLVNWFDQTFDARGRNSRLQTELETARKQAVGARAALAENAQLRKLLSLDRGGAIPSGYEPVTGRVIARSPTVWFSDVTIDAGSDEGIKVDSPRGWCRSASRASSGPKSAIPASSSSTSSIRPNASTRARPW